jgi:hypothetical protein
VAIAVVYSQGDGLAVERANDEQATDARVVQLQRPGHRAWVMILEDDGPGAERKS